MLLCVYGVGERVQCRLWMYVGVVRLPLGAVYVFVSSAVCTCVLLAHGMKHHPHPLVTAGGHERLGEGVV